MFDDDDFFKNFNHNIEETNKEFERSRHVQDVMSIVVPVLSALVVLVVLAVCFHLCCRRSFRNRGRVLAPPTVPPGGAAPYPQQQYTVAVTSYPVQASGMTYAPYPAHPAPPAPYPAQSVAPTMSAAPYPPQPAPYPAAPYTAHPAPSAPQADALPPSYDQVQNEMKVAPYNPSYPH